MRAGPLFLQIVSLSLWLGAAILFSAAVAPALFAVLPSRSLAGAVVGRILPTILYSGMLIALLTAAADAMGADSFRWTARVIGAVVMLVACGIGQLVIAPRIDRLRAEIPGAIESLPLDDARRIAFGRLHGISVAWLGLAMLAAAIVLVSAARQLQPRR